MSKIILKDDVAYLPRKSEGSSKRGAISPEQFAAWRKAQGLSLQKAADLLGVKFNTVAAYEGRNPKGPAGASIQTGLAMAAISAGLEPWSEKSEAELTALRGVWEAMQKAPRK